MTRPYSVESADAHLLVGDPNHADITRYLDTVGNGSGLKTMNAIARTYRLTPPSGTIYVIDEIRIVGWNNAITNGDGFCGVGALTLGCKLEIRNDPSGSNELVTQDLLDGLPLKTNGQLAAIGEARIFNDASGPACMVQCSICPKGPYRIEGAIAESLVFQTQDVLTGLNGLYVVAIGRAYDNGGL